MFKTRGGVKGRLNNVKKTALLVEDGFPKSSAEEEEKPETVLAWWPLPELLPKNGQNLDFLLLDALKYPWYVLDPTEPLIIDEPKIYGFSLSLDSNSTNGVIRALEV